MWKKCQESLVTVDIMIVKYKNNSKNKKDWVQLKNIKAVDKILSKKWAKIADKILSKEKVKIADKTLWKKKKQTDKILIEKVYLETK